MEVITYRCQNLSWCLLVNEDPEEELFGWKLNQNKTTRTIYCIINVRNSPNIVVISKLQIT